MALSPVTHAAVAGMAGIGYSNQKDMAGERALNLPLKKTSHPTINFATLLDYTPS
jgi:hypothetical protein